MSELKRKLPDGVYLLNAAAGWLVSALFLLALSTLLANAAGMGEQGLGYLSSALSFLAAVGAGFFAAGKSEAAGFVTALVCATALVIALLTLGFLIGGENMDPSSVISLVSFTYAGVLTGVVFAPRKRRSGRRRGFRCD